METIVFLHGWGVPSDNYRLLINSLGERYRVVAPNLCDLTEGENLTWKKIADNLDKLIGPKRVYLLGTSLGGGVAIAYAAFYPRKTKAIIACEPVGLRIKRSKTIWTLFFLRCAAGGLFSWKGIKLIPRASLSFLKESTLRFKKINEQARLILEKELDKGVLEKIEAPVYLLWSPNSELVPLEMGEKFHQGIFTSKFYPDFFKNNHLFILEQKEIAQKALEFLTPTVREEE